MKIGLVLISLLLQLLAVAVGVTAFADNMTNENVSIADDSSLMDSLGLSVTTIISIILSIFALVISGKSYQISKTSEQDRQREIRTATLAAQLNKKIIDDEDRFEFSLKIMNRGKAVAKDIKILINGTPATKYQNLIWGAARWGGLSENDIIKELGAGSEIEYPLFYGVGDPARMNIKLTWSDELNEQNVFEGLLLPITVRK
ncbi:MAG TPA: hypothetical protein PLX30_06430 [Methanothrix sp.]|nr:hypothetical protein [Methanothrix sp.]